MDSDGTGEFVAECLWPDVRESDLRTLDHRAGEQAARLTAAGRQVRYLGSLLMREDEVVLCLFAGTLDAVRDAATAAEIPFERVLETARSPWGEPANRSGVTGN
jgi:hypothetical protein